MGKRKTIRKLKRRLRKLEARLAALEGQRAAADGVDRLVRVAEGLLPHRVRRSGRGARSLADDLAREQAVAAAEARQAVRGTRP
jgi:hypothetical protein